MLNLGFFLRLFVNWGPELFFAVLKIFIHHVMVETTKKRKQTKKSKMQKYKRDNTLTN